jgi:hypothetical protein
VASDLVHKPVESRALCGFPLISAPGGSALGRYEEANGRVGIVSAGAPASAPSRPIRDEPIVLRDNRLPPEASYDAALTNGLLAIVADEWLGEEITLSGKMKAARDLLDVIDRHGNPFPYIDTSVLRDGLDLTQPARHGRSDDEFAVLQPNHVGALIALDEPSRARVPGCSIGR